MRAETRHSLKEDRFSKATLSAAETTLHWTVEHRKTLIGGAVALVVVLAAALHFLGGLLSPAAVPP